MRCELNRDIIVDVLSNVVHVLPSRTTTPVFENILLEVAGGKLALTGADGDNVVRKEVALEGKSEEGKTLLKGKKLLELIRESQQPTVVIFSQDEKVIVESGRMRATLVSLPPDDFPPLPSFPKEVTIEFPLVLLFEMFDRCGFAVSKDESRPALTAINWEIYKNESRMVATDSYRLACVSRKIKSNNRAKILLTPKAIDILPRGDEKVKVSMDTRMVGFQLEGTSVITRMIEGPYPEYEKVIPQGYPYRAQLRRDDFIAAVRRATVIAHPLGKQISLEFKPDMVVVRAENPDLGLSEEEVEISYKGEEMPIGFNGGYLVEILNHIDTENFAVEFSNPMAPVVFKPVESAAGTEDLFILMPVRLD